MKKPIKTTVKEVKTWMRTLEENRYKKTYGSDARRVSWLVNNNLAEDYSQMPVSMQKKWSKAAYGRERQLAKEFVKHKRNEAKLRESVIKNIKEYLKFQKNRACGAALFRLCIKIRLKKSHPNPKIPPIFQDALKNPPIKSHTYLDAILD